MRKKSELKAQVFSEIAPLKEVLVWGEPGIEALLGQLLPKSKSLFFSYYEVTKAREEFRGLQTLIEREGVKVIRAKDATARLLKNHPFPSHPDSIKEIKKLLFQRANEYYETYKEIKSNELANEGIGMPFEEILLQIKKDIEQILEEDMEAFGETAAMRINYVLSLAKKLPLANIFYGRDQSQTLADKIILSELKWDIRKPEVGVYKEALIELGYRDSLIEISSGALEGGDMAILEDTCYIGVGSRTELCAVEELCQKLGDTLKSHSIQLVAVINHQQAEEAAKFSAPTEDHMSVMHLDMFWIPLRKNLVMANNEEIDQRTVLRLWMENGQVVTEDLGCFREFLVNKGIEIMEVSVFEQRNFATNLLTLGNDSVIVALSKNERVNTELQRRGFRVINAELNKLVNGYGATHCLTAPIKRGD
ncbi:MAG TPA: arginine deiminase family protein [Anaerolineales bacterium]|nr:arginine deiminase family protein [Anaerolineales bacterium]